MSTPPEDRDHVMSEHHSCPECGCGEFQIAHRASNAGDVIRCADPDCNAQWTLAPRFFSCPFRPSVPGRGTISPHVIGQMLAYEESVFRYGRPGPRDPEV